MMRLLAAGRGIILAVHKFLHCLTCRPMERESPRILPSSVCDRLGKLRQTNRALNCDWNGGNWRIAMDKGSISKSGSPIASASAAAMSTTPATVDPSLPCPYRQSDLLQQALSPNKMRVGFFLGAGCPMSIRVPDGTETRPLIPDIAGVTTVIRDKMQAQLDHKDHFDSILKQLGDGPKNKKTVEHILTQIRGLLDVVETSEFDGLNRGNLKDLDKAICAEIRTLMLQRLPSKDTAYHRLAVWIRSIPRAHPVEIFTTNYDLLMEQALEECSVPYFDGFSGSNNTFFDDATMEQDDSHEATVRLPARWARLWKMHGSINWWKTKEDDVQRREKKNGDESLMIHPSHIKYNQSRIMPYFAMQDRLRSFLTRGQAVLVTCGYSFFDEHLNRAILQGLNGNPTAVCFGLLWGDRKDAVKAIEKVGHRGNLRLLAVDGGVLNTINKNWHCNPKSNEESNIAVCIGDLTKDRTSAPKNRCKFLLGDFKVLGDFLAEQLERLVDGGGNDET